jgi:hypothetical protein
MLAFVAGQEDMTFSTEISPAMLQDIKSQMLSAICQMQPTNTQTNLLVNRDKPPVGHRLVEQIALRGAERPGYWRSYGKPSGLPGSHVKVF